MKKAQSNSPRPSIGIVAGSGPEAGIDLWSKILARNQVLLGTKFRGDLDAPRVMGRMPRDVGTQASVDLKAPPSSRIFWPTM